MEFQEQGDEVRVLLRRWEKEIFRRVCVETLDPYRDDPYLEIFPLGQLIGAPGPDVSVVSISVGSHILLEVL